MRLWMIALGAPLFMALACGDVGGMLGGDAGGTSADQDEADEADDEDADEADEEDGDEDADEPDEEDGDDDAPAPRDRHRAQKECTRAALQAVTKGAKVTGNPKCVGRYGAAALSTGKKGVYEHDGTSWKMLQQGACTKPPGQVCKTLGF